MPHPAIKQDMVVYVGKDVRDGGYLSYTYNKYRDASGRVICFEDAVAIFTALGFETCPHWNTTSRKKGYMAAYQLEINFHLRKDSTPEVDPVVQRLLKDVLKNESFAHLLSQEGV